MDRRARVHVHDPRRTVSASASPAAAWEDDDRRLRRSPPTAAWEDDRRLRRSPPVEMRREREHRRAREQPRCGEVAGGTAAECAAVCCCFPLAALELVVLAAVRLPAALCRRAVTTRRRRRRAKRASAVKKKEMEELLAAESTSHVAAALAKAGNAADWPVTTQMPDAVAEAEKEVWASFQGAGFWRSPSQREVNR